MSTEDFKNFFGQLFTELDSTDSLVILLLLLGAYLIGLLFGWWQGRRGKRKLKKALKQKEADLITLKAEHEAVQEQLGLKEADLTKANLGIEELKTDVSKIEHEKAQLREALHNMKTEQEELDAENVKNITQIETLNLELARLESQHAKQAVLIENAATNPVANIDLSLVQSNYDNANIRLAAIEEKLSRMERENAGLKSEIANMKDDSSTIAFVDEEPGDNDEEIEIEDVVPVNTDRPEEMAFANPEERSAIARQSIRAAFGNRITIASADEKDDLKKINGVGPFIEQKLNDIGIFTFKQISQFDDELIQQVTDAIQFFPGRIKRDDWVGQAKAMK